MAGPFSHPLGQVRRGVNGERMVRIGPSRAWWPGQGVQQWMLVMSHLPLELEPHILQLHLLLLFFCVRAITEICVHLSSVIV